MIDIKEHEKWLRDKSIQFLCDALDNCPAEIICTKKERLKIFVPQYFYDFIDGGNNFKFKGCSIEVGYENAIVIFDKENGFANNLIYKHKLLLTQF